MFPCEMARYIAGFPAEARKYGPLVIGRRPGRPGQGRGAQSAALRQRLRRLHARYRLDRARDLRRHLESAWKLHFHLGFRSSISTSETSPSAPPLQTVSWPRTARPAPASGICSRLAMDSSDLVSRTISANPSGSLPRRHPAVRREAPARGRPRPATRPRAATARPRPAPAPRDTGQAPRKTAPPRNDRSGPTAR